MTRQGYKREEERGKKGGKEWNGKNDTAMDKSKCA
jgi:hypothetical protein